MKILVYGAGVLGSLYAAKLYISGYDVTLLARGKRFKEIEKQGVILLNVSNKKQAKCDLPIVDKLDQHDDYDLILVVVRRDQVSDLLPILAANKKVKAILFMVNNPLGYDQWMNAVGKERLLLGFAGAGGTRQNGVVQYHIVSPLLQPTTLAEPDGQITARIRSISRIFRNAGFPVSISKNMDAWQKTHVAWVSAVANAIYAAGGDGNNLAKKPELVKTLVSAIHEGFAALRKLNVPVTPAKLNLLILCPRSISQRVIRWWSKTDHFDIIATRHTLAAYSEMEMISQDFQLLARSADLQTPALDDLHEKMLNYQQDPN